MLAFRPESSRYSESSKWLQKAWKQWTESFVQNTLKPLIALGALIQKSVLIFQKEKVLAIIIAYVSRT